MDALADIERKRDIKYSHGKVIKCARIENRHDGHFKFYEIALEEMPDGSYITRTFWGKIGTRNPGTQVKNAASGIVDALAVFHDWLIEKKTNKGYEDSSEEPVHARG